MGNTIEILLFLYNAFLLIAYSVPVVIAAFIYAKTRKPVYLSVITLFVFFIFDNMVIYLTEFIDWFAVMYNHLFMTIPMFKTVIYLVVFSCMIRIGEYVTGRKAQAIIYICLGLLAVIQMYIPVLGNGTMQSWLYYAPAQLYYVLFSIYFLRQNGRRAQESKEKIVPDRKQFRRLLLITVILAVVILMEDSYVIFHVDVYDSLQMKIFNRSISEDVLRVVYLVSTIRFLLSKLQVCDSSENVEKRAAAVVGASGGSAGFISHTFETGSIPESGSHVYETGSMPEPISHVYETGSTPGSGGYMSETGAYTGAVSRMSEHHGRIVDRMNDRGSDPCQDVAVGSSGYASQNGENAVFSGQESTASGTSLYESGQVESDQGQSGQQDEKLHQFCREYHLTLREREILIYLLAGDTNAQISGKCSISIGTVKAHVHNIYSKLDITHRPELMDRYHDFEAVM